MRKNSIYSLALDYRSPKPRAVGSIDEITNDKTPVACQLLLFVERCREVFD